MDAFNTEHFGPLAIALVIGLLVGSERGWHSRGLEEGSRVAGIRTFTLIALLGGITAFIARDQAPDYSLLICTLVFLPVAALLVAGYLQSARSAANLGITTEAAAMVVYWLGTLPLFGYGVTATATAVILAVLLHLKTRLHHWLQILDGRELLGTLQFLLVSVVMLPLLPDQGYGPWQAINPYKVWWLVVLISGLSLVGYFAMRIVGARRGVLATSLTGGLVSSTSVTISLARLHREIRDTGTLAAGILLACATMFARIMVIVAVISPRLLAGLAIPMAVGCASLLGLAWWQLRSSARGDASQTIEVKNPFQLIPAIKFGLLLALVLLLSKALQQWFGDAGLYLLSLATGIADVDAIVLSLAPQAGEELAVNMVVTCITLAAASNTLVKGVYCRIIAAPVLGNRVLLFNVAVSALVLVYPLITWLL